MREVELFDSLETGGIQMAEQALVVETRLSDNARRARFIQPQIVAQTAQPATDILRAAPVLFADQHMQPTVKRLPAIVASDTVFCGPVELKIAERPIVKAADNRVAVRRVELTAQVVFLLFLRTGHLPERVDSAGCSSTG